MEEIARTLKAAISLLVLAITGKVLYDLLRELYFSKSLQHWGLVTLFTAIVSTVMMVETVTYVLDIPMWLHIWHIINLALIGIGLYHILMELGDSDDD